MSNKKSMTTLSIAAGTAFVASLAMGNAANAAEGANPFAMNELSGGYMQLAEAKCGGKKTEAKCGAKETEAKCGGAKTAPAEGKCGGSKEEDKKKEGKCGEGKCGGK
jgi:uncharacterized low-complexity protein